MGAGTETLRARVVVTPDGAAGPAAVTVRDGLVESVEATSGPVPDLVIAPGFVDLQVNGVEDVDCSAAEAEDWVRAGHHLAAAGVTGWLPTLISQPLHRFAKPLASIASAVEAGPSGGAVVLGAHLEGPFLGGRPGAHRPEHLLPIDREWLAGLGPEVRLVTIGAELDGAVEAIALLTGRGITVSVGHSAAPAEDVDAAARAGARLVTHLFNGMPPLHHRDPGVLGAALTDDRLAVSLIADGIHVDPRLFPLVFRAKPPGRVVLVTDAVAWRAEHLAALSIELIEGAPRLADGTLAGSALTMDRAVRNVVDAGIEPVAALRAASTAPADVLCDASRGRLQAGARADLVVLGHDDLAVQRTIVGGSTVFER